VHVCAGNGAWKCVWQCVGLSRSYADTLDATSLTMRDNNGLHVNILGITGTCAFEIDFYDQGEPKLYAIYDRISDEILPKMPYIHQTYMAQAKIFLSTQRRWNARAISRAQFNSCGVSKLLFSASDIPCLHQLTISLHSLKRDMGGLPSGGCSLGVKMPP